MFMNSYHEPRTLRQSVDREPKLALRARGPQAVTVTYYAPLSVSGTITGPTAQQALACNLVSAGVIASADGDTAATVTHNWALTAAQLALGYPLVTLTAMLSQALTALSAWAVATPPATGITLNAVVLTKLGSTGSGNAAEQLRVYVLRPHSIIT